MSRPPVRSLKSCTKRCTWSSVRLPGTTLMTRRCSGSKATWSQLSPSSPAKGSSGWQCFSFLATKDHFSSNCASRVWGGKSHALVVDLLGLLTSHEGQPYYRVLVHSDQATGLANATTLLQMLQDRKGLVLGKFGAVQGGALAFREALLAGATGQDTTILVGAIAKADAEVVEAAATVVGAARVLATE